MKRTAAVLGFGLVLLTQACRGHEGPVSRSFETVRKISLPEAEQAIAVDRRHVYAIGTRAIAKYDKDGGEPAAVWTGGDDGAIVHLNSGVVLEDRLYAAHSNYPRVPMVSSIEIFDTRTLEHVGSHSFGIFLGSATWVDRKDGHWWVTFANYAGRGGLKHRGPRWTTLASFDDEWRLVAAYVFPPEVVARFGTRSCSGGAWGPDGLLYATGHDAAEVYVLRIPSAGSVLDLVEILPVEAEGQGIAWDNDGLLYSIVRSKREAVVSRLVVKAGK